MAVYGVCLCVCQKGAQHYADNDIELLMQCDSSGSEHRPECVYRMLAYESERGLVHLKSMRHQPWKRESCRFQPHVINLNQRCCFVCCDLATLG